MKCETCHKKIELLFLKKPNGTCIKDDLGKKHWVCFECQAIFKNDKAKILDAIFKR
jgi:Zn-finger protein